MAFIAIENKSASVERFDEVSKRYEGADFMVQDGLLAVSREGIGLAWYSSGSWAAVLFDESE